MRTNQNSQLRFGLYVDGVLHRACGIRGQGTYAEAGTMIHLLTPDEMGEGAHSVQIQWSVTAGQGQIRPVTHSNDESASVLIEEIYCQQAG